MSEYSNTDLMDAFYIMQTEKTPGVSREEMQLICHTPWAFLKQQMESGELPLVRMKFFGTFQVYKGKAKLELSKLESKLEKKSLTLDRYNEIKTMLNKFIENYEK